MRSDGRCREFSAFMRESTCNVHASQSLLDPEEVQHSAANLPALADGVGGDGKGREGRGWDGKGRRQAAIFQTQWMTKVMASQVCN